jgi:hypothetical protein
VTRGRTGGGPRIITCERCGTRLRRNDEPTRSRVGADGHDGCPSPLRSACDEEKPMILGSRPPRSRVWALPAPLPGRSRPRPRGSDCMLLQPRRIVGSGSRTLGSWRNRSGRPAMPPRRRGVLADLRGRSSGARPARTARTTGRRSRPPRLAALPISEPCRHNQPCCRDYCRSWRRRRSGACWKPH